MVWASKIDQRLGPPTNEDRSMSNASWIKIIVTKPLQTVQLLCIYLCLHPTAHLKSWPGAKCAQLQNDAYLFLALKQRRNCAARSYTSAVAAVLWTLAFYWPPINLPGPQTTQSNLGRKNDRCLKLKTQLKLWVKDGQHKVTKWDTGPLCFRGCGGLGGSRQPIWYSSTWYAPPCIK